MDAYTILLRNRASQLARAIRYPTSGACAVGTATAHPPTPSPVQQRAALLTIPINCSAAGDNFLIQTLSGRKLIYEVVLWNVSQQTLRFTQGPAASALLLLQLTNFPAITGLTLGFNGSFAQPHWEVAAGQPLILNLSAAFQVDGFIRYRIAGNDF